jgi:hypothetical protein
VGEVRPDDVVVAAVGLDVLLQRLEILHRRVAVAPASKKRKRRFGNSSRTPPRVRAQQATA